MVGLIGAVLLIVMLVLMLKQWRVVPIGAIIWTLGIAFLTLTSWNIAPNPRLLITAFPAADGAGLLPEGTVVHRRAVDQRGSCWSA